MPGVEPGREPGGIIWLVGLIDLMLPWVGVPFALAGLVMSVRDYPNGWWFLAIGIAMLIADALLTFLWARPAGRRTDQPTLNQRGAQYVGRLVEVVKPIRFGEGRVRVGDTIWLARGPDCDAGTWVRVVAVDATCLTVAEDDAAADSADRSS